MRSSTFSRWATESEAARSRIVRSGVVAGMPSSAVTSSAPSARERWIRTPSRRRPLVFGTVTSIFGELLGRNPHSAPAL